MDGSTRRRWDGGRLAPIAAAAALLVGVTVPAPAQATFTTFESGVVRPLALAPSGARLFACNTPDGRLEILDIAADGALTPAGSVAVGLEPVAVAARSDDEVWVVNHLSDSVSVVRLDGGAPRVVRTLLVGDEPRDVVFAGPGRRRAFVTTARRGQNLPAQVPALLTTPGVPRALVWVFDANALGAPLGGTPLTVVELFADTPRALAVTPDGATVYAAAFLSGNRTTAVSEGVVCDGGASAAPCTVAGTGYPGGLPAPNANLAGVPGPETGLIVRFDGSHWVDGADRVWDAAVRFSLPDLDVFAIDATADPPVATAAFAGVGTTLFNMAVNPATGALYVSNGDARNAVRFEGPGGGGSTVRGRLLEARVTVIEGGSVTPHHLNPHLDYAEVPSPPGTAERSLATPLGMAVPSDGRTLWVAAFGSGVVAAIDTAALAAGTYVPSVADHVAVPGGPVGLALDEARNRLYVATRFDDAIATVDLGTRREIGRVALHDPEPPAVAAGRPLLYDARRSSTNGEAACASCHVFGDLDALAWDLGNPDDDVQPNPNPFHVEGGDVRFHPMKGPMTTQSLRGLVNHGPMHWRGDRSGGTEPEADPLDAAASFRTFRAAFDSLLGLGAPLPADDMERLTAFVLALTYPPNPVRNLDGSLTPAQQAGRDRYFGAASRGDLNCNGCHVLSRARGFFGSDGFSAFQIGPQPFKVPHLRNAYTKVGMFGMPSVPFLGGGGDADAGPQVRGFGFLHDGSVDTLHRFHRSPIFTLSEDARVNLEQFVLAYDSNLAPVVGQQVTRAAADAAVETRLDLLATRAAAGDCDLVAKGVVAGEARGFVLTGGGLVRSDRAGEPPLAETALRALADTGRELTYTCVPPGSGTRAGIDRDADGHLDRDELDAGSDPTDPQDPGGTPAATPSPTPTPAVHAATIATGSLRMRGGMSGSRPRTLRFRAVTRGAAAAHRIVAPPAGGPDDPRTVGGTLRVRNAAGLADDDVVAALPPSGWSAIGARRTVGFRYRGPRTTGAVRRAVVRDDLLAITVDDPSWGYTLDETAQGRVALVLTLGDRVYCAEASGRRRADRPGRFVGGPDGAPTACP